MWEWFKALHGQLFWPSLGAAVVVVFIHDFGHLLKWRWHSERKIHGMINSGTTPLRKKILRLERKITKLERLQGRVDELERSK